MVPVSVVTTHKNIRDTDIHNNLSNYRLLVPPRQKEARRKALSAPKPGCSGTTHIAVRETGSAKAMLPFFLHKSVQTQGPGKTLFSAGSEDSLSHSVTVKTNIRGVSPSCHSLWDPRKLCLQLSQPSLMTPLIPPLLARLAY